jgi:hypothetical protein
MVNFKEARKEPRNRFCQPMLPGVPYRSNRIVEPARQAGNRFLGSIKGLQKRALVGGTTTLFLLGSWPLWIVLKFKHISCTTAERCDYYPHQMQGTIPTPTPPYPIWAEISTFLPAFTPENGYLKRAYEGCRGAGPICQG